MAGISLDADLVNLMIFFFFKTIGMYELIKKISKVFLNIVCSELKGVVLALNELDAATSMQQLVNKDGFSFVLLVLAAHYSPLTP